MADTTVWRVIPGTGGMYMASSKGEFVRVCKTCLCPKTVQISVNNKRGGRMARVAMMIDGAVRRFSPITLMVMTFLPPAPPGKMYVHKNASLLDNRLENIILVDQSDYLGNAAKRANARMVVEKNADGEIVGTYTSITDCARQKYLSPQSIAARCDGQVKKPYALTGTTFEWGDPHERPRNCQKRPKRGT